MAIDYIAEDEALDKELEAIYNNTLDAKEKPKDSPIDESLSDTGSTEQEETKQENESQANNIEGEVKEIDQPTVPMVEETRYKEAVRAMNQAQRELAEYRKQGANYDNQIAALQQQVNDLLDKQTNAPNTPDNSNIDDDAFNDAKEIYPEVINPLLKLIDGLKQELGQVKSEVGQVKTVTNHYQQSEQDQETQRYWDTIRTYYPNVDDIAESPDYAEWYDSQSPGIQQLLTSQNAYDVINGLRFYQQATPQAEQSAPAPVPSQKPDKLAAAKAAAAPNIKSTSKPEQKTKFTLAQIDKMSNAEFAKYEAEIDEAMAAGEIY